MTRQNRGKGMDMVQRTRGIRKFIRTAVCGSPLPKYVTAGDKACGWLRPVCGKHERKTAGRLLSPTLYMLL